MIRQRQVDDLPELEDLARTVHHMDSYPAYLPDDNLLAFVVSDQALDGWVAIERGRLVGHVALHSRSSPGVVALAATRLGVPATECGVVARFIVARDHRRIGLGRALLNHATEQCRSRLLTPILDVVEGTGPVIALYERVGWRRLGTVSFDLDDGSVLREHVYVAPNAWS